MPSACRIWGWRPLRVSPGGRLCHPPAVRARRQGGAHHLHDEVSTHAALVSCLLEAGVLGGDTVVCDQGGAACPTGTCLLVSAFMASREEGARATPAGRGADSPGSPPGSTLCPLRCRRPSRGAVSLQGRKKKSLASALPGREVGEAFKVTIYISEGNETESSA